MKRLKVILLLPLVLFFSGCGMKHSADISDTPDPVNQSYYSDTSPGNCYLCSGIENLIPSAWGQNNVALISLNTFESKPIEINRYDKEGQLIEEYAGFLSLSMGGSENGGFFTNLMLEYDRGYATGTLDLFDDETLDIDKAASFLCNNCLHEILTRDISQYFGVGLIHLETKKIRLFEKNGGGFGLRDFYTEYNLREQKNGDSSRMGILIFYCPMRYEPEL